MLKNKICSCHNIAKILLKLVLNTNQSINQSNIKWSFKTGSIHIKFSMTGQKKYDLLIQVAA